MGLITKQITVVGSKSQRQCEVLFDNGASVRSNCRADLLRKWKIKLDPIAKNFVIDEKALKIMLV